MGAEILSNNTAEMQAVIETLLFLLAQVELENPVVGVGESVIIHSDSRCVIELITHGSRYTTNIVMRDFLSHLREATGDLRHAHRLDPWPHQGHRE